MIASLPLLLFTFNSTLNSIELGTVPTRLESLVELLLFCFIYLLHCFTASLGVCELDRVGLQDLVELDFTTGRKRVQRSQRVQEEPEVLVADTMDVPEGNGNPLGMDSVELGKLDRLVKEMLQTATNRDKGLFHHQCRTTTLRSSWE
ncbi:unnamed protein product [Microthlaspi erraticum]|uniref:Uncharacterized protein n=1 Tax=Microthlaspi erraticum TaxID=1685480 RepID=A0A6D2J419_9BRAS|nr:unnamed protein product [Microthlaspi erraticum]